MTERTKKVIFWVVFLVLLLGGSLVIVNAIGRVSRFNLEEWVACGLVLAPALAVALGWRIRHIFASGWVRLAAAAWGGWLSWCVYEGIEDEIESPIEFAFLAIIIPAILALASWWIARGFGKRSSDAQGGAAGPRLLAWLVPLGLAGALGGTGLHLDSRIDDLEWELQAELLEIRIQIEETERTLRHRIDALEIESEIKFDELKRELEDEIEDLRYRQRYSASPW